MIAPAETTKKRYQLDDSRLTLLVSQAALELDRALRHEGSSLSRAHEFFSFLRESLHADAGLARSRWLDPETVNVFEHTLRDVGSTGELRTVEDVVRESLRYVEGFGKQTEQGSESDLRDLLRFCVAFGNSLLAHRAQYCPEPPANPYRR
jgi:hypothetical protein